MAHQEWWYYWDNRYFLYRFPSQPRGIEPDGYLWSTDRRDWIFFPNDNLAVEVTTGGDFHPVPESRVPEIIARIDAM